MDENKKKWENRSFGQYLKLINDVAELYPLAFLSGHKNIFLQNCILHNWNDGVPVPIQEK